MSSGIAHERASRVLSVILLPAVWLVNHDAYLAFGAFAGSNLGVYLTPDLDVDIKPGRQIRSVWKMRRFGLFGALWKWYWWPYSVIMPHRSRFSHWPIVSTIIRLLYLLWPVAVITWYVGLEWLPLYALSVIVRFSMGVFIGLCGSDVLHFAMDVISTWVNKRKKKRR